MRICLCIFLLAAQGCSKTAQGSAALSVASFVSGDARLAYTVDLPSGPGPFPGVVLGHGSGRITRHDLVWFSREWTARGFAVLRFDKRGVGESTGTYSNVGVKDSRTVFPVLAADVVAAARVLQSRPEIDRRRVGLAGNSQAGWILPLAAREMGDAAFVVLVSGPVCSVGLEMYYSDLVENTSLPLDEAYAALPAFHGAPGYDPLPALTAGTTPTLWLLGADDRSIPVRNTIDALRTLSSSGKPYEWRTYPGLGHSLPPSAIWPDIEAWLRRRLK